MPEAEYKDHLCTLHIGLDDFDLHRYGCTTHTATFLIHKLISYIAPIFIDYPNLVRLNPSIPWKTRGNGAVALHIKIPCSYVDKVSDVIDNILLEYYKKLGEALDIDMYLYYEEPGAIIVLGSIPPIFSRIYLNSLTDVVLPSMVLEKLLKFSEEEKVYVSNVFRGRGIVGAVAAIGWLATDSDYTYELIVYRSKQFYNMDRCIDTDSVRLFDNTTNTTTFNNIDYETNRVLITSHGYDPVLYGVRGDDVYDIKKALDIIKPCEPVAAWTIFRTNQATDAHAVSRRISDLRIYRTAKIKLRISGFPKIIQGGHVIVKGIDDSGSIDIVFFKPSGLVSVARRLIPGDTVVVQGHVKSWYNIPYLHVEKIFVEKLAPLYVCKAPRCPICRKRMTKKGFGKGYSCKKCRYIAHNVSLECTIITRDIVEGLYIPPPSELKHLVKPLKRYGRERSTHPPQISLSVATVSTLTEPLYFL
ncbi:MAG: tRNA(Ile)(2)-agmatinylcytidine synthase [Ignisphaera sp.]|uniref:tRNA(Ile2) 2-agmatinylcytidine synthetase TiaS n=1 Tax=Ignisphaera aggregans TaxID=334771 RepID=A0A7J3MXQ2_9CREN